PRGIEGHRVRARLQSCRSGEESKRALAPAYGKTISSRGNGVVEIESEWTARDSELRMFGEPARIFACENKDANPRVPGYSGRIWTSRSQRQHLVLGTAGLR